MSWRTDFNQQNVDVKDPNPWLALYLDTSLPFHDAAKRAFLSGQNTWSRRLLLPLVRPLARLWIILVQLLRMVIPEKWNSSRLLHHSIYWGLKTFVRPEANYLILRHFNIGSELLRFIADNVPGVSIKTVKPLRPRRLEDLIDDTFLIHDLNIYNFIAELNSYLREHDQVIVPPKKLNFDAITDGEFDLEAAPNRSLNVIDLHTAVEFYTPIYALLLSDHDFWRASNSLQLDETVAIYISRLTNEPLALALVSNRHPTVPVSTLESGFRLMLHGLDAEILHAYLREKKRAQTA